ncbi:MAG: GNAT family N-acetyltransferase [Brevundimonas sp.]|uniref:GNAT family N-acetyltransferase n=1 Tax=Brevundimonas sp. TaxID=1871086 RepID=UPI00391D09DB
MIAPGPTLETERLILRPTAIEDFPRWAESMADESARFIGGPMGPEAAWRGFMTMAGAWALTGVSMFSMIDKASGLWIGRIGPWRPEGWPGNEVGYGVHPEARGKGLAFEAAVAAMDYAFEVLDWRDVIHCIDPANVASQALARRLGSSLIGPTKLPPPYDHVPSDMWGQTREQWRARRSA